MNHFIVAIGAVVFTTVIAVPARADFMFFHGGHSYLTVTTSATWAAAAGDAATRRFAGVSGTLARIDDGAENAAIIAALLANIPPGDFGNTSAPDEDGAFVWIGATDRQNEGQWLWDGEADSAGDQFWQACPTGSFCDQVGWPIGGLYNNSFASLHKFEPDDGFFSMTQDAAGVSLVSGRWFSVAETNALYYLVEFNAVPEPATLVLLLFGTLTMVWIAPIRRQV